MTACMCTFWHSDCFLGGAQTSPNCTRARIAGGGSRGVDPPNSLQRSGFWEVPRHHQIARVRTCCRGGGPGGLTPQIPCKEAVFGKCPDTTKLRARARTCCRGGGPGGLTPQIPCKVAIFGKCPDITKLRAHTYCRGGVQEGWPLKFLAK